MAVGSVAVVRDLMVSCALRGYRTPAEMRVRE